MHMRTAIPIDIKLNVSAYILPFDYAAKLLYI